jgi:hypothetical protein
MRLAMRVFVSLVTMVVWGVAASSAATLNVSTAAGLQTALNTAVAGDEIVLANGTYAGAFLINGNNGTSGAKITVRAANPRQAILLGDDVCSRNNTGVTIQRQWWVIQDLTFQNHGRAMWVTAANVEIHDNVIVPFHEEGIRVEAATAANLHHNVLFGTTCPGADSPAISLYTATNSTVRDNIIYGITDNGYQFGNKTGYGILVFGNANNNLLQGNLVMQDGKAPLRVLGGSSTSVAQGNIVRDNMIFFGEGGFSSDDCADDATQVLNNFVYGQYHSTWSTKGNWDGNQGHHIVKHNTFVLNAFSRVGGSLGQNGSGCAGVRGYKIANVVENNVFYSPDVFSNTVHTHWAMQEESTSPAPYTSFNYNLWWANSAESTWRTGFAAYQSGDIHNAATPPIFTNVATGDYTLAPASPGYNAGNDGASMGIAWNSALKQAWAAHAFALATQEHTGLTGGTSTSFTVNPARYQQVWFYIPNSPCAQSAEQFTVAGDTANLVRDISGLNADASWIQPGGPARYITLGRHLAGSGTLTVSWQHANCVERVFIRELPTAEEAYAWITAVSSAPTATITTPTSGTTYTALTSPLTTLAGTATDDVGVTGVTWSCPTCTPTSGTASCATCGAAATSVSWSVASIALAAGANVITVTASDGTQTGTDTFTVTFGVLAKYPLDGTVNDTSGNAYHGTLPNGGTYVSGQFGQALSFNGTNTYVNVTSAAGLNVTGDMTIAFWANLSVAGNNDVVLTKENNAVDTPYHVEVNNAGTPVYAWYHHSSGGDFTSYLGFYSYAIPLGVWHRVLLTRTLATKTVTLYINGILQESDTWSTDAPSGTNTAPLRLGANDTLAAGRYLQGILDEVVIDNRVWSLSEIQADAQGPRAPALLRLVK